MRTIEIDNDCLLQFDDIVKEENRISFSISVILRRKRTDTDIQFKTDSYIDIDEWQQKSEELLSEHKLELENFSFHANHKVYEIESRRFEKIQNFFELSSNIHNKRLKFEIESKYSIEKKLFNEISTILQSEANHEKKTPISCAEDGIVHIKIGVIKDYKDESCSMQLELFSENFHMTRTFEDLLNGAIWISGQIQQFNKMEIAQTEILGNFIELEFNWVDGMKKGKGSICDFTWPNPNELTFDGYVEVEWVNVDKKDLPLIS